MPHRDDQQLRATHERLYGRSPELIASAPGRVNLIGEHIDYSGGIVLPMAIDRHAQVGISRYQINSQIRVQAMDLGESYVTTAEEYLSSPPTQGHWSHYVLGPLVLLDALNGNAGIDITFTSDVPMGAGLSSSAALQVAVARAVNELFRLDHSPIEIAKLCQQSEHHFVGVPCGLMDQAAASLAPAGTLLAFDCQFETGSIIQRPSNMGLIVIDSGIRHTLGDSAYRNRRQAASMAAESLGFGSLREVKDNHPHRHLNELQESSRQAAEHAISEMERVKTAIDAIQSEDLQRLGRLLNASHTSLRDTLRVSCHEVDQIVDIAQQTPGVLGARMTGGGFGGCVIVLAHSGDAHSVSRAVLELCPPDVNASVVLIDASDN